MPKVFGSYLKTDLLMGKKLDLIVPCQLYAVV